MKNRPTKSGGVDSSAAMGQDAREGNSESNSPISGKYQKRIKASPSVILPLFCPVEEYKWIPDWDCEMVHSISGVAEQGCVFKENFTGSSLYNNAAGALLWSLTKSHLLSSDIPSTTWTFKVHDPDAMRIRFELVTEEIATIVYDVNIEDMGDGVSEVTWLYVFTPLNKRGRRMQNRFTDMKMRGGLAFLGQTLKYYCETGQMLKPSPKRVIKSRLRELRKKILSPAA